MHQVSFVNKVWSPSANKKRWFKVVLLIAGSIIALGTVIQILFDGFKEINFWRNIFLPAFFIWYSLRATSSGNYISALLNIEFGQSIVNFIYPQIDRQDGKGNHVENISIAAQMVQDLQYSHKLKSIRILYSSIPQNLPEINTQRIKNEEMVLYPAEEQLNDILTSLEKSFGCTAMYLN